MCDPIIDNGPNMDFLKRIANLEHLPKIEDLVKEQICINCGHKHKYHSGILCGGAFPNGTDGINPQEVFYGECHCHGFQ